MCRTLFELMAKTLVANAPTETNYCPKSICCKITKLAKHSIFKHVYHAMHSVA